MWHCCTNKPISTRYNFQVVNLSYQIDIVVLKLRNNHYRGILNNPALDIHIAGSQNIYNQFVLDIYSHNRVYINNDVRVMVVFGAYGTMRDIEPCFTN